MSCYTLWHCASVGPKCRCVCHGSAVDLKNTRVWVIFVIAVVGVAFVLSFIGLPATVVGPAAAMVVVAFIVIRANNRAVANVAPAERDRLLAEGPPAGYGLVYPSARRGGGFAVGST